MTYTVRAYDFPEYITKLGQMRDYVKAHEHEDAQEIDLDELPDEFNEDDFVDVSSKEDELDGVLIHNFTHSQYAARLFEDHDIYVCTPWFIELYREMHEREGR